MTGPLHALISNWRRRNWRPNARADSFRDMQAFTVVTGASRGLGLALAGEFARSGDNVLMVARSLPNLEQAAATLSPLAGGTIETLALDLGERRSIALLEDRLRQLNGYADVLVNNAALGYGGMFASQAEDELERLMTLNVTAPSLLMRRFLPDMLARGRGGVLNVASLGGLIPGPCQAAYYASKSCVISMTEAVAWETAGMGVRVSVLAPGPIATGFHRSMGAGDAYYLRFMGVMGPEKVARAGLRGYRRGQTLIVPGIVAVLCAVALRVLPHSLMVPFIGWLLEPDRAQRRNRDV